MKGCEGTAVISDDGRYRYLLSRTWQRGRPLLTYVMLNPSIASADVDDATIRRCCSFAAREGYGGLYVLNLYGLRARDPRELWRVPTLSAVGPENDEYLSRYLRAARLLDLPVLAAWGAHARDSRVSTVMGMAPGVRWVCLGVTQGGAPKHPVRLHRDTPLEKWRRA